MYYHFSKVAQLLIYPLNIALILLMVTYYCQRRGRLVAARRLIIANLAFLWILSLPIVANTMMLKLESIYPVKTLLSYPKADAIVVLGGSVGPVTKPRLEAEESGGARVTYAARLFKAGKAPFVLVTGGGSYQGSDQQLRTESTDMRDVLLFSGVPEEQCVLERQSRTTEENARYSSELLKQRNVKTILLVTSAFHLRRAVPLFTKYGFEVHPVPTGFIATEPGIDWNDFVPNVGSLERSTQVIKELVGYLVNRIKG